MPFYHRSGKIPAKRHTQFRKPDGVLYSEELISTEGFSSIYSLVYHCHPPTLIKEASEPINIKPEYIVKENLKPRSFMGFNVPSHSDYVQSRITLMGNKDVELSMAKPQTSMKGYFFKNADADEVIFVHEGKGIFKSIYGQLSFSYGDYIVVPRGTIYQMEFEGDDNKLFITESFTPIYPPKRYTNSCGQLLEHSPYCERDIRTPENLETHDEKGDFVVKIKKSGHLFEFVYATHPFDAVGWDGYVYPYIFSIHNFEPITGRLHMPPPIHQTFEGKNFVICSFVPRMYDYHPLSVPAPYNHSNVDSDEVLYYVDGDFMSRKHVEKGMFTLHPKGIPHGPHPGTVEKSLGAKETKELAVMIDPFYPLYLTKAAMQIEDPSYYKSWVE